MAQKGVMEMRQMLRDILLVILGLSLGTLSPHLATLFNALFSGNWGLALNTLTGNIAAFVVEAIIAIVIVYILYRLNKKGYDQDKLLHRAITNMRQEFHQDITEMRTENQQNTDRIISAIRELRGCQNGKNTTNPAKSKSDDC
jgi:hypothetical protein